MESSFSDFMNFIKNMVKVPQQAPILPSKSCPKCGQSLVNLAKTSKMGCGYCYTFFQKEIIPVIQQIQASLHHVGKKISHFDGSLQEQLDQAVREEKYEEAARIKTIINSQK